MPAGSPSCLRCISNWPPLWQRSLLHENAAKPRSSAANRILSHTRDMKTQRTQTTDRLGRRFWRRHWILPASHAFTLCVLFGLAIPDDPWAWLFGAFVGLMLGAFWAVVLDLAGRTWRRWNKSRPEALLTERSPAPQKKAKIEQPRTSKKNWLHTLSFAIDTQRANLQTRVRRARRKKAVRAAELQRQREIAKWKSPSMPEPDYTPPSAPSASHAPARKSADTNPLLSAAVSAATGSTLLGWAAGGSLGAAMLGDAWHKHRNKAGLEQAAETSGPVWRAPVSTCSHDDCEED